MKKLITLLVMILTFVSCTNISQTITTETEPVYEYTTDSMEVKQNYVFIDGEAIESLDSETIVWWTYNEEKYVKDTMVYQLETWISYYPNFKSFWRDDDQYKGWWTTVSIETMDSIKCSDLIKAKALVNKWKKDYKSNRAERRAQERELRHYKQALEEPNVNNMKRIITLLMLILTLSVASQAQDTISYQYDSEYDTVYVPTKTDTSEIIYSISNLKVKEILQTDEDGVFVDNEKFFTSSYLSVILVKRGYLVELQLYDYMYNEYSTYELIVLDQNKEPISDEFIIWDWRFVSDYQKE